MRTFESGATRNSDENRIDPEAYLSPSALYEYCSYMKRHALQADGKIRSGDNWQKGMPRSVYMKSLWRHMLDLWLEHRGYESRDGIEAALCGIIFNAFGYLLEYIEGREL